MNPMAYGMKYTPAVHRPDDDPYRHAAAPALVETGPDGSRRELAQRVWLLNPVRSDGGATMSGTSCEADRRSLRMESSRTTQLF
jgi:hypothetical protein